MAGSGNGRRGPAGRRHQERRAEVQRLGKARPLGRSNGRRRWGEGKRLQAGQIGATLHAGQLVRRDAALAFLAELPLNALRGAQQHEAAFAHLR